MFGVLAGSDTSNDELVMTSQGKKESNCQCFIMKDYEYEICNR